MSIARLRIKTATLLTTALAVPAGSQQVQQGQSSSLPPSAITRIEISPRNRTVIAGDSIRLRARALDAAGQPVSGAIVFFSQRRGFSQGLIDSTGMLVASSVGKFPITVTAIVPGTRPVIDSTIEIAGVPAPASRVAVMTKVGKLVVGQDLRVEAIPFSKANDRAHDKLSWSSSAPEVATVNGDGVISALGVGHATITGTAGAARASFPIDVVAANITSLTIAPVRASVRQGDVVHFSVSARAAAGAAIAGLTPTWSFSPGDGQIDGDGSFVAYRPGDYQVSANVGARGANTIVHVAERNVRRPVTVVGRVPRTLFPTSEVWIHPNGKVAYLGTHGGGDRVYAIDISNPSNPVVVDSIQANTRLVNDMQTTADGNYMVLTREGAADRKNGIVIADTHDPLHPKELSQFTDGVAAGVHSVYIYENAKYGKYVFITNDGTGAIDIVNITDPAKPTRAGEWRTNRPDAARYVHDLDIVDGLMYASYWNDGLVILDIGNGKWGGRPDKPVLVSQYKYDLDSLYREVEQVSGSGFTRGTHTAWRQRDGGKYVFIADEVYLNGPVKGAKDASSSRMYGTLQVVDVSDIQHPKTVAWYTPEQGGVHNVWVVKDTLYLGAYDAGFHVFDISGDLKGELRAQGREIASLNTADMQGNTANAAFTWGVVVNPKDGLAYVNDFNNGLWIVRIEPRTSAVIP
jgi:hypothetical protein